MDKPRIKLGYSMKTGELKSAACAASDNRALKMIDYLFRQYNHAVYG